MGASSASVAILLATTIFSGLVLTLRLASRVFVVRVIGSDDVFALISYLIAVVLFCMHYLNCKHGLGNDLNVISLADLTMIMKYSWIFVISYITGICTIKMSALLQFLRFLFEKKIRILCWVLIYTSAFMALVSAFLYIFSCRPIRYTWDKTIPHGTCYSKKLLGWWMFVSILIVVTDFMVVAIPISAVKDLNMKSSHKKTLIVIFALGGVGCLFSVARAYYSIDAVAIRISSKIYVQFGVTAALELNIGIVCVSLPPLKALVTAMVSRSSQKVSTQKEVTPTTSGLSTASTVYLHPLGPFLNSDSVDDDDYMFKPISQTSLQRPATLAGDVKS